MAVRPVDVSPLNNVGSNFCSEGGHRHSLFLILSGRKRTYFQYRKNSSKLPAMRFLHEDPDLSVMGLLGTASVLLEPYMTLNFPTPGTLTLSVENAEVKKQQPMWGLTRTLIQNAVNGMTDGFTVPLYLVGVGYRAALESDPRGKLEGASRTRLNMKLGFSHPVIVPVLNHVKAEVPYPMKISLSRADKH